MGYRYQDVAGNIQVAEDIRGLHRALKEGALTADTLVLDESVNVRLKAAALIAFKAREAASARSATGSQESGQQPAQTSSTPQPGKSAATPAPAASAASRATGSARSPARTAPAAPKTPARRSWVAVLLGVGIAGSLALLIAGVVIYQSEREAAQAAAREDMKSIAKAARDSAREVEKELPKEAAEPGRDPAKPLAKLPLGRDELLASVLPLLRKTQAEMTENTGRFQRELEELNIPLALAPETLLSRDGLARNTVRIKSFNTILDRLEQSEDARMKKLVSDVHATLAKRLGGPEFAKGFEEGLNRSRKNQDEFIRIQRDLARLFQRITDFMAARLGTVTVKGEAMMFSNDADVAAYQQYMKELQQLAKEETAVQRKMVEAMKRTADQLDEWSK